MKMSSGLVLVATVLMLVVAATGDAWADPATISLDPTKVDALQVGETFTVNVMISDVSNLYGWQVNVTFNPSVLGAVRIVEGPFLEDVNETVWPKPVINNSTGYVFASSSLMPPYPAAGASGSGQLASITFSVKAGGGSDLRFDETRTYLRTVVGGSVQEIGNVVRQDGTYGIGGGGFPWELIGGAIAVVVVVVVVGVFLMRRRKDKAEGVVR